MKLKTILLGALLAVPAIQLTAQTQEEKVWRAIAPAITRGGQDPSVQHPAPQANVVVNWATETAKPLTAGSIEAWCFGQIVHQFEKAQENEDQNQMEALMQEMTRRATGIMQRIQEDS